MGDVDPEVAQLALDRQQATQAQKKISRPASFLHSWMDTRYILRPEAIESVFYMYRITGDPVWQDKGWQMWESIERVSWTELAYSAITNVNDVNSTQADSMERYP
jgi:mannosyl-oligosaccharide alpha-1,2-mannosidase